MNPILEILEMGDGLVSPQLEPLISKMRASLPEPGRTDCFIVRSAYSSISPFTFDPVLDYSNAVERTVSGMKVSEWEKVLIRERGISYWAWRNRELNLVVR